MNRTDTAFYQNEGRISSHFIMDEFRCRCGCGVAKVDLRLVKLLEDIREHFGVPISVNSGYRCPVHNTNVGGATNSMHMTGYAADIWSRAVEPHEIYNWVDPWHTGGLGSYATFTHIDVRDHRARW